MSPDIVVRFGGVMSAYKDTIQLNSPNYAISSSFRKIFNVSSNEIINLCRYMFNCPNIENLRVLCVLEKENFRRSSLLLVR